MTDSGTGCPPTALPSANPEPPSGDNQAGPRPQLRTCAVCRQRKVKCDRQQPCSSCVRSGCDCVYPIGRGRAPKTSRRVVEGQLVDKLARLETIIQHLAAEHGSSLEKLSGLPTPEASTDRNADQPTRTVAPDIRPEAKRPHDGQPESFSGSREDTPSDAAIASLEGHLGRLVMDDKKSYYVSNPLWATMMHEVGEMRDIIAAPEDEEDDHDVLYSDASSNKSNTNPALFGYRSVAHSLRPFHPQLYQAVSLFSVFSENVQPLLPIFHMPTLSRDYWDAIASLDSVDRNTEALVFAIYYAAIISMPAEQCSAVMGLTRDVAVERYRFAVEQALARADLLNTQSVVLLQAVVLFLSALRNQDDSRTTWSLTVLVFHIAQAMGLHRDGTAFGVAPFETELRRRLWWHILILDSRASDQHGLGPINYQSAFDTRMPLNVNDADLAPDMAAPPAERDGATEMTFLLVRCEAMRTAARIQLLSPDTQIMVQRAGGKAAGFTVERIGIVRQMEERLRTRYIEKCDERTPILMMSSLLSRLIIVHFWIMMYYPFMSLKPGKDGRPGVLRKAGPTAQAERASTAAPGTPGGSCPDMMNRDQLFSTSVEALGISSQLLHSPNVLKYKWYSQTHVQWHIVAFVLSEICRRPPSPECDRAWASVTEMYHTWNMHDCEKRGPIWKSVRRLMAKAKYVREMQAASTAGEPTKAEARAGGDDGGRQMQSHPLLDDGSSLLGLESPSTWTTPASGAAMTENVAAMNFGNSQDHMFTIDSDDPLMDLLNVSMDLPMEDIFTTAGTGQDVPLGGVVNGAFGFQGWN